MNTMFIVLLCTLVMLICGCVQSESSQNHKVMKAVHFRLIPRRLNTHNWRFLFSTTLKSKSCKHSFRECCIALKLELNKSFFNDRSSALLYCCNKLGNWQPLLVRWTAVPYYNIWASRWLVHWAFNRFVIHWS